MGTAEFDKAYATAPKLGKGVTNEEQLELYSLAKVGKKTSMEGVSRPSAFDFKNKYKYDAWKAKVDAGVSADDAQAQYISLVNELVTKYGLQK